MTFLQNDDNLYVKIEIFLLIDILKTFPAEENFPVLKHFFQFEIDVLQIKEKVKAWGLSYIKFMEKRRIRS